jgi:hypothetical protein
MSFINLKKTDMVFDRNSVTHSKNQNGTSNVFDIHVKTSSVGLEINI